MSIFKCNFKSILAIFMCLALLFGEAAVFSVNAEAETFLQSAPLLDVELGEEFIVDDGNGEIRHFPFVYGFGDDVFVTFSQHTDTYENHPVDGMRISRDGGLTWPTYIEAEDFYLTKAVYITHHSV